MSSCVVLDTNNKSMVRHLRQLTPHKSYNGKMPFVNRCVHYRVQFDGDNTNTLCTAPVHTRNSYVHVLAPAHSLCTTWSDPAPLSGS